MSRVKKGVAAKKHKKYLLRRAKGYLNGANSKFRLAKERLLKADSNAYKSRKLRKRDFRKLWIARINGALDQLGSEFSYSKFMGLLKKNNIELNRKSLAEIAVRDINAFKELTDGIVSGKIKGNTKKEEVKNQVSRPSTIKKSKTSKVKTTKKEEFEVLLIKKYLLS
ncbi:MAG: 50S ribosomal protein L20 [Thermales bacterium]|nr:50S ribosomal protein L20 [Thermales bacterium]